MNSVNFPDGSAMSTTELSVNDIQKIFQVLTCSMLGIFTIPTNIELTLVIGQFVVVANTLYGVYIGETVIGAGIPDGTVVTGIDPATNKVYLSNPATANGVTPVVVTDTLAYSKVRIAWQTKGQPGPGIADDISYVSAVEKDDEYNRIREAKFVETDDPAWISQITTWTRCWQITWEIWGPNSNANGNLIRDALMLEWTLSELAQSSLYIVPDMARIDRVPRNEDGQWWEVCYLTCEFNEAVTQILNTPTGASVELTLSDAKGVLVDTTIEL